jgi:hypothetical protein
MAVPQALTPEQIQQIIAAGRGNTVNLNGTIYQGNYADTGSGETLQQGALQDIYSYDPAQNKVGGTYNQYDPTGMFTRTGTQQEVNANKDFLKFLAGSALTFALPGALNGSLFGGAATAAPAGDVWAAEMAAAAPASEVAAATAAANAAAAATTGLTASQIANLAKAGISLAGLTAANKLVSNTGNTNTTKTTAAPITYSGGGAGGYSPDYFSQVQSNYNSLMPNVPRDVASPLQNWYSTEFNPGASVTGSLFGDMAGGTTAGGMTPVGGVKPVTTPVVKPVTTVIPTTTTTQAPLYTSLTKTSTPTDVSKAYSSFIANAGGNTAANRKAATDYLTNLGLTQGQIESSYNTYLNTLPAAGNTYQELNAKANVDNIVKAYQTFIGNAGGNTAANRELATNYLKDIGVPDTLINQAYTTYLGTLPAAGNTYQELNATATPTNIAQAYSSFVSGAGGDTAANQAIAINYLKDIGLSDEQINQAYNIYTAGATTGGGMLSGGANTAVTATEPSYTTLGASSSPQAIAAAYADFVASAGGDTAANQQLAVDYLTGLGISPDTINLAYGLFKGA